MKVLVVNAGSSSLKFQLINMADESVMAKGNCEKIGIDGSFIGYSINGVKKEVKSEIPNHDVAISLVLNLLTDKEEGVISSLNEINAVGHRKVYDSVFAAKRHGRLRRFFRQRVKTASLSACKKHCYTLFFSVHK